MPNDNATEQDRLMSKIRKCLALSKSSNEHEAAAALRQAQKMMEANNITLEAIHGAVIGDSAAKSVAWRQVPQWEGSMAMMIARTFGCKVILEKGRTGVLASLVYVGVKQSAMLASYTHEVFQRQVLRGREAYLRSQGDSLRSRGEKMAAGETFCRGYISNVSAKVSALRSPRKCGTRWRRSSATCTRLYTITYPRNGATIAQPTKRGPRPGAGLACTGQSTAAVPTSPCLCKLQGL